MLPERLDRAQSLKPRSQIKINAAAIIGDMLEFFDYYLIGFVLAFIVKPWGLTFGQVGDHSARSSGVGAILGAFIWGRLRRHAGPAQGVHGDRDQFLARQWRTGVHAR